LFEGFCKRKEKENRKPLSSAQPAAQPVIFFPFRGPGNLHAPAHSLSPAQPGLPPLPFLPTTDRWGPPVGAFPFPVLPADSVPSPVKPGAPLISGVARTPRTSPRPYKRRRPSPLAPIEVAAPPRLNPSLARRLCRARNRRLCFAVSTHPRRDGVVPWLRVKVRLAADPFLPLPFALFRASKPAGAPPPRVAVASSAPAA